MFVALVGPTFDIDTRDDTIYPTRGFTGSLVLQRGIGLGDFDNRFTRATLGARWYVPTGNRSVLAIGTTACRVSRETPFFNMCSIGITDKLRGYAAGQHMDTALLSAQAELRVRTGDRFGVAAFVGGSAIGAGISSLGRMHYAGGAGIRFRLSRDYPVDFSIDRAVNDDGDFSTYIYVGQAF